jgi:feruloyl esterase
MERQGRPIWRRGSGTLITGLGPLRDARRDTPVPIARGFATWGTDAGHQNEKLPEPRAFGLNDEANVNMAYASYKKTHDLARLVATAFYDRAPAKIYYYGGSQGGREALMMAQRFPMDYDGIVSVVPTANYAGEALALSKLAALQRAGGWTNPEGQGDRRRRERRLRQIDGLADGVVRLRKCLNLFDPSLRCPNGADTGNTRFRMRKSKPSVHTQPVHIRSR